MIFNKETKDPENKEILYKSFVVFFLNNVVIFKDRTLTNNKHSQKKT